MRLLLTNVCRPNATIAVPTNKLIVLRQPSDRRMSQNQESMGQVGAEFWAAISRPDADEVNNGSQIAHVNLPQAKRRIRVDEFVCNWSAVWW